MRTGRNIHLVVPGYLLDQIQRRALISGRTRAAELRYLLSLGLTLAGGLDVILQMNPGIPCRALVSPRHEIFEDVADRSERFERSMATEALRMISYAIDRSSSDAITTMSQLSDRVAPCTQ